MDATLQTPWSDRLRDLQRAGTAGCTTEGADAQAGDAPTGNMQAANTQAGDAPVGSVPVGSAQVGDVRAGDAPGTGATAGDAALLLLAGELAIRAAAVIMRIRTQGFETLSKADDSPVTEADRQAEALILRGLRDGADLPVIAEEEVAAGIATRRGTAFWLVDPLDGTREFAAGRDNFTVNVGLVRDGRCVLGAVALPAEGTLYLGWNPADGPDGRPVQRRATRIDADGARPIRVRTPPPEGLTVLASRHYADDPALKRYLGGQRIARLGNIGSAVKFVRVAEGAADLYPRLGPTMEWDTAAPQAVVEAAGGSVRLFEGGPLSYGKQGFLNPHFVCRGGIDAEPFATGR